MRKTLPSGPHIYKSEATQGKHLHLSTVRRPKNTMFRRELIVLALIVAYVAAAAIEGLLSFFNYIYSKRIRI
jgi:hypothetical protein